MEAAIIRKKLNEADALRNKGQNLNVARKVLRDVFKDTKGTQMGIQVYLPIATLELDLGNISRAKTLFEEGIALARRFNERVMCADLLRKYAYMADKFEKHSYRRALTLTEEAICICKKEGGEDVQKILASAYATKGNILYNANKMSEALRAYQTGLNIANRVHPARALTLYGDIANVYIAQKQYRRAQPILEKIIEGAARYYRHALPSSILRVAYLFFKQKEFGRAYAYTVLSELAARATQELGSWKREVAESLELKGELLRRLGDRKLAKKTLTEALEIYRELGYAIRVQSVRRALRRK